MPSEREQFPATANVLHGNLGQQTLDAGTGLVACPKGGYTGEYSPYPALRCPSFMRRRTCSAASSSMSRTPWSPICRRLVTLTRASARRKVSFVGLRRSPLPCPAFLAALAALRVSA